MARCSSGIWPTVTLSLRCLSFLQCSQRLQSVWPGVVWSKMSNSDWLRITNLRWAAPKRWFSGSLCLRQDSFFQRLSTLELMWETTSAWHSLRTRKTTSLLEPTLETFAGSMSSQSNLSFAWTSALWELEQFRRSHLPTFFAEVVMDKSSALLSMEKILLLQLKHSSLELSTVWHLVLTVFKVWLLPTKVIYIEWGIKTFHRCSCVRIMCSLCSACGSCLASLINLSLAQKTALSDCGIPIHTRLLPDAKPQLSRQLQVKEVSIHFAPYSLMK